MSRGDEEIVRHLLKQNAHVNAQDKLGQTALHLAVIERHERIVVMLLEFGATFLKDCDGNTPVDVAPYQRLRDILKSAL